MIASVPEQSAPSAHTTYDYLTVQTSRHKESLYRDIHQSFGWTFDGYLNSVRPTGGITLKFKRDRHIGNRTVADELQRTAEEALTRIERLERNKAATARASAWGFGVAGSGLLAGSVFSLDAGMTPLSVVLGAIGLLLWVVPFVVHPAVRNRATAKAAPQLDRAYEELYSTAEQAAELLR
ncbi:MULTISPECIES: hypothetical protein [unclassified Streptomyces]|uniref:hypothetical protein n=1 Tax=unclassified Streptomyces TaxID=2593676 RepID=UPI0036EE162A